MIKIGLYGYFHKNAYCDDLIMQCTEKLLKAQTTEEIQFEEQIGNNLNEERLNSFDLIIICGGSSLANGTPAIFADDRIKVPLCIFGTGYRKEDGGLSETACNNLNRIFKKAAVISVRGHRTLHWLTKYGIDCSNVIGLGDPVFAFSPTDYGIGSTDDHIDCIGGNIRTNVIQSYHNPDTEKFLVDIYNILKRKYNKRIKLFSFSYADGDNDLEAAKRWGYKIGYMDLKETVKELAKCSFWIGQRLHPFVVSLCVGIKAIGIEYQFEKMWDCCSTINYPYWLWSTATKKDFVEMYEKLVMDDTIMSKTKEEIESVKKNINIVARKIMEVIK